MKMPSPKKTNVTARFAWVLVLVCALFACVLTSCSKNQQESDATADSEEDKKEKDAAKKLEDEKLEEEKRKARTPFVFRRPFTQLIETIAGEEENPQLGVKPGHWSIFSQEALSNLENINGELDAEFSHMVTLTKLPVVLDDVPFILRTSRNLTLPKEEKRRVEVPFFVPTTAPGFTITTSIKTSANDDNPNTYSTNQLVRLPTHQYFLALLASNPKDYTYLASLDSIRAPAFGQFQDDLMQHYRIIKPRIDQRISLPTNALEWTALSLILWDGINPAAFGAQEQALLDWVHWGGQVIISGPNSLSLFKGTELEPILPALDGGTWNIPPDFLRDQSSSLPANIPEIVVSQPWSGIALNPTTTGDNTVLWGTDEQPLIIERQIGRGRIVVTAFQLTQRELIGWPGFDSLFNAIILRRPARTFSAMGDNRVSVRWTKFSEDHYRDNSRLRFFSRDQFSSLQEMLEYDSFNVNDVTFIDGEAVAKSKTPQEFKQRANFDLDPDSPAIGPGVAAWNDHHGLANVARESLRSASLVRIPDSSFVARVVPVYLLLLVPANWLLFRLLRRVEWAWIAAPIISIAATVIVVRLAMLDIGFSRSVTAMNFIEAHADYPRGHLTRYISVYSSLTSNFDVEFDNPTAQALPFSTGATLVRGQQRSEFYLRKSVESVTREDGETVVRPYVRAEGFRVPSASTQMLHEEEILDLDGSISLARLETGELEVTNGTSFDLTDVSIVRHDKTFVHLGALAPGAHARFREDVNAAPASSETQSVTEPQDLDSANARHLYDFAVSHGGEESLGLVAMVENGPDNFTLSPAPGKTKSATVLFVHLIPPMLSQISWDTNLRSDVVGAQAPVLPSE